MESRFIEENGQLRSKYTPAIYFDTSVIIDYWMTEGMELPDSELNKVVKRKELPHLQVVRDLIKSDKRVNKVSEIRRKILFGENKVVPVTTTLSLLELTEWHSEAAFKQIGSDALGASSIQKLGKKQVGDYLKDAVERRQKEIEFFQGQPPQLSTGLEIFIEETWLDESFSYFHGLEGILLVDLINLNISVSMAWQELSLYAYVQLGLADILHIMAAKHLGCQYIASFDSDFKRIKPFVLEQHGITVLTNPEEVLEVL